MKISSKDVLDPEIKILNPGFEIHDSKSRIKNPDAEIQDPTEYRLILQIFMNLNRFTSIQDGTVFHFYG